MGFVRSTTNKFQSAFTLIEMMVVIGILSIVSYWAVPSIKKAHEALNTRRNTETLATLYDAMRAYYLVFNEFPEEVNHALISPKVTWAVPSNFYTRELDDSVYPLNIKPLSSDSGVDYDIDNWFPEDNDYTFYISIRGISEKTTEYWRNFLEKRYPYAPKTTRYSSICLGYPEIPQNLKNDALIHENRFY